VTWYSSVALIVDDVTMYLFVFGLIPLILGGAFIIMALKTGEMNKEMFLIILSGIVGMFIVLLIWVSMTKNY